MSWSGGQALTVMSDLIVVVITPSYPAFFYNLVTASILRDPGCPGYADPGLQVGYNLASAPRVSFIHLL